MTGTDMEMSGGCQCGAVRFHVSAFKDDAHICHCRMCQKAAGNLFAALVGAPKNKLEWTRGTPATFMSSDHVARGFCSACGTPLFYDDVTGNTIGLMIGALDNPQAFKPVSQDGVEGRMPWFVELNDVPDKGVTGEGDDASWAAAIANSNNQHPDHDTQNWPPAK